MVIESCLFFRKGHHETTAVIPLFVPLCHQQKLKAHYYLFWEKDTGSGGPEVQNPAALNNRSVSSFRKQTGWRNGSVPLLGTRGSIPRAPSRPPGLSPWCCSHMAAPPRHCHPHGTTQARCPQHSPPVESPRGPGPS